MTRLVVTADAAEDAEVILQYLHREAGFTVAQDYGDRFRSIAARLAKFPESGTPRPDLGLNARIAVAPPYVLVYDYLPADDVVVLLRILHGRRDISERLYRR